MTFYRKALFLYGLCYLMMGCVSFGRFMQEAVSKDVQEKKTYVRKIDRGPQSLNGPGKSVGKIDRSRPYKRTNHERLQEKSLLGENSGSLWVERGQGSYLFAQNTNRLVGDLVNIEIEGQAKKQVETKVSVIKDLIARIKKQKEERRQKAQIRQKARSPASKKKTSSAPSKGGKNQDFQVKIVPSRISDILKDGSYMVQGDQPFMIGKKEYKLVVKGIVRQENFDDQGISSDVLLEPKFDIVTSSRSKNR